jgi:hypothetical protein
MTRYRPNGARGKILNAIAEAFDIDVFSEYEPQFGASTRKRNGTLQ